MPNADAGEMLRLIEIMHRYPQATTDDLVAIFSAEHREITASTGGQLLRRAAQHGAIPIRLHSQAVVCSWCGVDAQASLLILQRAPGRPCRQCGERQIVAGQHYVGDAADRAAIHAEVKEQNIWFTESVGLEYEEELITETVQRRARHDADRLRKSLSAGVHVFPLLIELMESACSIRAQPSAVQSNLNVFWMWGAAADHVRDIYLRALLLALSDAG